MDDDARGGSVGEVAPFNVWLLRWNYLSPVFRDLSYRARACTKTRAFIKPAEMNTDRGICPSVCLLAYRGWLTPIHPIHSFTALLVDALFLPCSLLKHLLMLAEFILVFPTPDHLSSFSLHYNTSGWFPFTHLSFCFFTLYTSLFCSDYDTFFYSFRSFLLCAAQDKSFAPSRKDSRGKSIAEWYYLLQRLKLSCHFRKLHTFICYDSIFVPFRTSRN